MTYIEEYILQHPIPKDLCRAEKNDELCRHLRDYPWIPDGMTESECVSILEEVAARVGPKYRFGYNDNIDMASQAIFKMIIELKRGKFKPRGDKALARQLRNFLSVWMRNRLSNYRREYSCRYTNPDSTINKSKYNIMHALKINSQNLTQSEIFARNSNTEQCVDYSLLRKKIINNLSLQEKKLFLQKEAGVILSEEDTNILINKVKSILGVESETSQY